MDDDDNEKPAWLEEVEWWLVPIALAILTILVLSVVVSYM